MKMLFSCRQGAEAAVMQGLSLTLFSVFLLFTVATRLGAAAHDNNYNEDELLAELDLLLPNSADNIQVRRPSVDILCGHPPVF